MIALTSPDGHQAYVFPEHIVAILHPVGGVEGTHAELWLVSGEHLFVKETQTEVFKRIASVP